MQYHDPNSTFQNQPYLHDVFADPTGRFLVAIDRGTDLLRTYSVRWDSCLTELGVFKLEAGNGPRHGVFVKGIIRTFFYLLGELTNSLHGFEVLYGNGGIEFRHFYNDSTFQTGFGDASGVATPSEIALAEGSHLVLSVRNDGRQRHRGVESDTIVTYKIDLDSGGLKLIGMTASGGKWPRSFAISKDGTMIAVGNQYSQPGTLCIFERTPETGVIDDRKAIAEWTTLLALTDHGSISMVIWDELVQV